MPALEQYKKELPYSYACGYFPALEALKKRPETVSRLLLSERAEGEGLSQALKLCGEHGIRVEYAEKVLRRLSGKENCFAAAVVRRQETPLIPGKHLVLHHISDAGNLGTILRTALGFGYQNIAVITPAADYFAPHVIRSCMGAVFSLSVREYAAFEDYRKEFPNQRLFPFMLNGKDLPSEAARRAGEKFSLVFGNEGAGLPEEFLHVGTPVRIHHSGEIDSLNLAVAAAIGMYAFSAI